MAAKMVLNGSHCITTPVLFSMEMQQLVGPINMVPVGLRRGVIEFAGISAGRPARQPLVRIDGGKPIAEYIYGSAAADCNHSDAFLKNVGVLDGFMDDTKIRLSGTMKVGRRVLPKEMTVRELAGLGKRNKTPEIADIIKGAYDQVVVNTAAGSNSSHVAKNLFNSAVLAFAAAEDRVFRLNSANLFVDSANALFNRGGYAAAAIAADYAQDIFGTLGSPKLSRKAGTLASDAWLRSVEEFEDVRDWPGFFIGIRYGLLSAMKAGYFSAMERFYYQAARHYETTADGGYAATAAEYRLRAAVSVLQNRILSKNDWKKASEHIRKVGKMIKGRLPSNAYTAREKGKEKIKALSALYKIAEDMSGR
ncbi:MAG: hypothetical protein WC683_16235 [bacterium]